MGAFGGWGKSEFASSFSNAGGLGIIAALNFPNLEDFKFDMQNMKNLTDRPFGVNLSLPHHTLSDTNEDKKTKKKYLEYVEIALNENSNISLLDNIRQGQFENITSEAGFGNDHKARCVEAGDYNNDGYLD